MCSAMVDITRTLKLENVLKFNVTHRTASYYYSYLLPCAVYIGQLLLVLIAIAQLPN